MMTTTRMQKNISLILIGGTLLAALCVCIGGVWLLIHRGHTPLDAILHPAPHHSINVLHLHQVFMHDPSVAIIEIGLIFLVLTQLVRVALVACFYAVTHDIAYTIISLFILCILIYSTVLQPYL